MRNFRAFTLLQGFLVKLPGITRTHTNPKYAPKVHMEITITPKCGNSFSFIASEMRKGHSVRAPS